MNRRGTMVAAIFLALFFAGTIAAAEPEKPADGQAVSPAKIPPHPFVQVDLAAAVFGKLLSPEEAFLNWGAGLRAGARWKRWDCFGLVEFAQWGDQEISESVRNSVLNIGVGVGVRYFNERMRSSLALGPSILLTRSEQHPPGTTGLFLELRPAAFRIPIGRAALEINPLGFSLDAPILSDVPLFYLAFRTALTVDVRF